MGEYLVVTGLSGAGRSQAAATLDDLGWFVIDNMPTTLIARVAELVSGLQTTAERIALVVGRDAGQLGELEDTIARLRATATVRVLYLEASDEVLVRRFEGTRRRHPIEREGVTEAIDLERVQLEAIRPLADVIIDTSDLNVHQLRDRLIELFNQPDSSVMQIGLESFGFKYGVARDVDTVFDCRFLPNPHWVEELRPLTGLDAPVRDYVLEQPETSEFLTRVDELLAFLLPSYQKEGKSYLTVAVGCTGGRHRSVVVAEELAARLRERGYELRVHHRDITR